MVAIQVLDKIDLKTKIVTRDKEHYTMIKKSIQEEDITKVNIYSPNIGAPKYIKQILTDIKGEINSNSIIVGEFNTMHTSAGRSSRKKINKETLALNGTLNKLPEEADTTGSRTTLTQIGTGSKDKMVE